MNEGKTMNQESKLEIYVKLHQQTEGQSTLKPADTTLSNIQNTVLIFLLFKSSRAGII